MRKDSNIWPPQSRLDAEHSTKEIEHRFTDLEASTRTSDQDRVELHEIVERHSEKLTLHEKAILGLMIGMATLLQDKFPKVAALLLKGHI